MKTLSELNNDNLPILVLRLVKNGKEEIIKSESLLELKDILKEKQPEIFEIYYNQITKDPYELYMWYDKTQKGYWFKESFKHPELRQRQLDPESRISYPNLSLNDKDKHIFLNEVNLFMKNNPLTPDNNIKEFKNMENVEEKAVSKKQQKFMGIVRSVQKGETDPSTVGSDAAKAAKTMKPKDVKDFAKTKHKNLPEKIKEGWPSTYEDDYNDEYEEKYNTKQKDPDAEPDPAHIYDLRKDSKIEKDNYSIDRYDYHDEITEISGGYIDNKIDYTTNPDQKTNPIGAAKRSRQIYNLATYVTPQIKAALEPIGATNIQKYKGFVLFDLENSQASVTIKVTPTSHMFQYGDADKIHPSLFPKILNAIKKVQKDLTTPQPKPEQNIDEGGTPPNETKYGDRISQEIYNQISQELDPNEADQIMNDSFDTIQDMIDMIKTGNISLEQAVKHIISSSSTQNQPELPIDECSIPQKKRKRYQVTEEQVKMIN